MKIFFLNIEKYVDFKDESQNYALRLPILNCGLVTEYRDCVYQRILRSKGREAMNKEVLDEIIAFQPDLVVYSTPQPEESIAPEVFQRAMEVGIPVFAIIWDSHAHLGWMKHEVDWVQYCNYFGVVESISNFHRYRSLDAIFPGRRGFLFTAGNHIFTDVFYRKSLSQQYDVSLAGSNEGQRVNLLSYLRENLAPRGISLHKFGGLVDSTKKNQSLEIIRKDLQLTDRWIPMENYVDIINQSKICLSSQTLKNRNQIKGRIFEYLACGAFVLSDANPDLQKFVPENCIAYYESPEDCLRKVIYYIENEAERIYIAENGYRWFCETFNYKRFWSEFLNAVMKHDVNAVNALSNAVLSGCWKGGSMSLDELQVAPTMPQLQKREPHVLFIGPTRGNYQGCLDASRLANYSRFNPHDYYVRYQKLADEALLQLCQTSKPDVIFLGWPLHTRDERGQLIEVSSWWHVQFATLEKLAHHMHIPIVGIFEDSVWKLHSDAAERLLPYVKFHVVPDSMAALRRTSQPEKYLSLWHPFDRRIFHDRQLNRDIPVSFLGHYSEVGRREGLEALGIAGIPVYSGDAVLQGDRTLTWEEYAEVFMRSKIVVNFSRIFSADEYKKINPMIVEEFQLKGRVFETLLTGAMLLEEDNPETRRWLEPMIDYVPFINAEDLVRKVKYYLENEEERLRIAANGYKKAHEKYTETLWWHIVLQKALGVSDSKVKTKQPTSSQGNAHQQVPQPASVAKTPLGAAGIALQTKIEPALEFKAPMSATSKLLTIIVTGRNDNYMGNFKYRIATCLNFLSRQIKRLNRLNDVEFLVADWNSDVPLSRVLPLSVDAARICRFLYVPPSLATEVLPDKVFSNPWAQNAALRRGKGAFMMLYDPDSLMPFHSVRSLFDLLDGIYPLPQDREKIFYFATRYHLPWEVAQREPTLDEWERYMLLNAGQIQQDRGWPGLGVCISAQMLHCSIWYACRGNNQSLVDWGWTDAELTLRITQLYPWIELSSLGIQTFHMEHWAHNQRKEPTIQNPPAVSPTFVVNDEDWGLANYDIEIQAGRTIE